MQIAEMKAAPPHLRFDCVAVEDREESIKQGRPMFKQLDHVTLTPRGSRDSVTKPVLEWLENSARQVQEERLPESWYQQFQTAYAHWKRGEEIPLDGSPLVTWVAITPHELQQCKSVQVLTIEHLAQANEECVRRLGMGGRALQQRAAKYLEAAAGPGRLMAENKDLTEKLKASEARREFLEARVAALEPSSGAASPVVVESNPPSNLERKL